MHRFSPKTEPFGLQRMAGRPVKSRNGEQLSTITDFLVDPQTGRVHFAMLPSGGGPRGMTYRIVPISAFVGSDESALVLRLDRTQWDRVGTMDESMLRDRVTIDVDHQQRLSRQLSLPLKEIYDGRGAADLVRATTLRGQSIRSGKGQLGRVEDVVIDVTRRESAIVLSIDLSFGGPTMEADRRYVVPYQQLGRRDGRDWRSELRPEDFPRYERVIGAGEPTGRGREALLDLGPVATAAKRTLDRSWARGRVEVVPERNRLVLRGILDSDAEREEIEQLVGRTAPDVRIENQIAVRRR